MINILKPKIYIELNIKYNKLLIEKIKYLDYIFEKPYKKFIY